VQNRTFGVKIKLWLKTYIIIYLFKLNI